MAKQDYGLDILDMLGLDPKELNQALCSMLHVHLFTFLSHSKCTRNFCRSGAHLLAAPSCLEHSIFSAAFIATQVGNLRSACSNGSCTSFFSATVASHMLLPRMPRQVLGLKRLAPYREERGRQYANTAKLQELRQAKVQVQRPPKGPKAGWAERYGNPLMPSKPAKHRRMASGDATALQDTAQKPAKSAKQQNTQPAQPAAAKAVADAPAPDTAAQPVPQAADTRRAQQQKEQRLKSYDKLTLRVHGPDKGTKRSYAGAEVAALDDGLTKGERKRLKRSQKREKKRVATAQS